MGIYSLNVKFVPERWRTGSDAHFIFVSTGVTPQFVIAPGLSIEPVTVSHDHVTVFVGVILATATSPVDGVGDLEGLVGVVVTHHVNVIAAIVRKTNFFIIYDEI